MAIIAHPRGLTAHPAFRWLVALWFAALLGLGLWVMPPALHQEALTRTGLVLPPPLTAQIALSATGALVGLLLGLLVAARAAPRRASLVEEWGWEDEAPLVDEIAGDDEGSRRRLFNPRESMADEAIPAPFDPPHEGDVAAFHQGAVSVPGDNLDEAEWSELDEPDAVPAGDAPIEVDALADLTLPQLTERLARALNAQQAGAQVIALPSAQGEDDVAPLFAEPGPDAALRSALERLSRVQRR